ncbi:MAG: TonB-dependent receptor [Candidatus Symbiothrix sp.]|nr:TonB-dependent receptor [Candidatus Symbiothrix sp.]
MMLFFLFVFCSNTLNAQQKTISGTLTEASTGEPVIGASIQVKGTTIGTASDIDGHFTLSVPDNAKTLTVSYIGFLTQELPIDKSTFSIVLKENTTDLDELVVIGYGTQKKRDLTGSVSSVSAKDIQAVPVSTIVEAMTGKMAGVTVQATEGSPDAEMIIRVRGGGSITSSNSPLYIVDGFPVNSISDIAASDIASMDVLKDASSTAIYGARGANGVIIITTKRGEAGKVTVNYNAYLGYKKIAKTMNVLNPYDYASWQYERAMLLEKPTQYTKFFGNYQDMDMYRDFEGNNWQDLTFGRTGHTFNQNLSISGGSDVLKYQFNYSHIDSKEIMQMSDYKRDNLSLKLNSKPHKRVDLDFSVRWSQTVVDGAGVTEQNQNSSADSRLKHAVAYTPIPVPNLGSDDDEFDPASWLKNPITALKEDDRYQKRNNLNLNGGASWEIIDNLKLRTEVGLDQYNNRSNRFYGANTYTAKNNAAYSEMPMVDFSAQSRNSLRNTNTLSYKFDKLLPADNNLNLLVGQELLVTHNETLLNTVQGFDPSFDLDLATRLSASGVPMTIKNTIAPDDKLSSVFGRLNYDYAGRYLLAATFRADGSSKFARGHRWGYFPSVSAGWRVSGESFMETTKSWLYDLKLRASYGTVGNNNIPSGSLEQLYTPVTGNSLTWINGYKSMWNPSKTMANPDLKWETTITRNIGLDFSFFGDGRLNGTVEAYLNTTKDLLILFPMAGTGYDDQYQNIGETQNKGVEITLNYTALNKKNFGLNLGFNIGFNKGRINSLGGLDVISGDAVSTRWASTEIGQDFIVRNRGVVGEMYGYRNDGRYEVSDFDWDGTNWTLKPGVVNSKEVIGTLRPGSMKLKDLDGDNNVTAADREVIGNANPLHTGGFNLNARVYDFDLTASFNWSYGNDVYNANKIEWTSTAEKYNSRNMLTIMESGKRWTDLDLATGTIVNDPETLATMNANTTMWSPLMRQMVFSDWAVEDGSFLRLNTLTLGYTLPKHLSRKFYADQLRVYASAYNVFCLTNYSGFDPEVSTRRNTMLTPGVDYSAYPKSRQFVFGINLTF